MHGRWFRGWIPYLMSVILSLYGMGAFAWNALGHRLVAQMAYDHLLESSKHRFEAYNHALDVVYKPLTWIDAAVWLDTLRYQDIYWYAPMHYIDRPFSEDGTALPEIPPINAVFAIEKSILVLNNRYAKAFDKGVALRILMHVVGDLHQPLHAVTRVSALYPQGDRGGNLVVLKKNRIAKNLHAYWDRGGGLLVTKKAKTASEIEAMAKRLEQKWPCDQTPSLPKDWADQAYLLAIHDVYQDPVLGSYQKKTQQITEKQLALAACHLAFLLNQVDKGQRDTR